MTKQGKDPPRRQLRDEPYARERDRAERAREELADLQEQQGRFYDRDRQDRIEELIEELGQLTERGHADSLGQRP